jgi:hypothetical protein
MNKGDMLESESSEYFHREGVPVLVSSLVLRSMNLGQIDIAYLKRNLEKKYNNKWTLVIIETKFSIYPSGMQLARLRRTQDYLSRILEMESKLEVKFCQKADHSLDF